MVDPGRIEVPLHEVDPDEMLSAAKKSTYGWKHTLSYPLKLSISGNAEIPCAGIRRDVLMYPPPKPALHFDEIA